jgi:hypothetical protein
MLFLRSVPPILLLSISTADGFVISPATTTSRTSTTLAAKKDEKGGYQFGDLTKSLFGNTAKKLTGKDEYKFGDITKSITGKEDYEFGDISKALDEKAKAKAAEFTGKLDYKVGDISKEIVRRVKDGDYTMEDIILLCKILLTLGAEFSPIASALPAKFLLEMMNYSLANEVGGKVFDVAASTLDKRMKEAVTGDADYAVGDLTKKSILKFIGKDDYEFGDLSRKISEKMNDKETGSKNNSAGFENGKMGPELVAELDQLDRDLKLAGEKP